MGLLGREADLHLFAPPALMPIIDLLLEAAAAQLTYKLHFHPLTREGILIDENKYSVECFRVYHRIECWGFLFKEKKKPRKINKQTIGNYQFTTESFERLKMGENVTTEEGELVSFEEVTVPNTPAKSYAYCADTVYNPAIADKVNGASLIYHETTYLKDLEERALHRFHSTQCRLRT